VFAHELDRSQKPQLETGETGLSGFGNWTLRFCRDRRQSRVPLGFDKVPLLRPSHIWMKKRREPRQPERLEWWLIDLIDKKKKN
jgi:hypothetical protein